MSGYIVSPKKISETTNTIDITYETKIKIFVLLDICELYVVNKVIRKNGAAYAFVKNVRM